MAVLACYSPDMCFVLCSTWVQPITSTPRVNYRAATETASAWPVALTVNFTETHMVFINCLFRQRHMLETFMHLNGMGEL